MTITAPSESWSEISKTGRGARNLWKSGRGDVAWQHRGLWSLSPEFKSRPRPSDNLVIFFNSSEAELPVFLSHFNEVL